MFSLKSFNRICVATKPTLRLILIEKHVTSPQGVGTPRAATKLTCSTIELSRDGSHTVPPCCLAASLSCETHSHCVALPWDTVYPAGTAAWLSSILLQTGTQTSWGPTWTACTGILTYVSRRVCAVRNVFVQKPRTSVLGKHWILIFSKFPPQSSTSLSVRGPGFGSLTFHLVF